MSSNNTETPQARMLTSSHTSKLAYSTHIQTTLSDGVSLLMSFFSGSRLEVFDHPIAAAYRWPMDEMVEARTQPGFDVTAQHSNSWSPPRI